jgi:hypothetical protein
MLVVDANGLPVGFHLDRANTAEVKLAEQTLDTIGVSRPRGRPKCQARSSKGWRGQSGRRRDYDGLPIAELTHVVLDICLRRLVRDMRDGLERPSAAGPRGTA